MTGHARYGCRAACVREAFGGSSTEGSEAAISPAVGARERLTVLLGWPLVALARLLLARLLLVRKVEVVRSDDLVERAARTEEGGGRCESGDAT